jgi:hypothetical protein
MIRNRAGDTRYDLRRYQRLNLLQRGISPTTLIGTQVASRMGLDFRALCHREAIELGGPIPTPRRLR